MHTYEDAVQALLNEDTLTRKRGLNISLEADGCGDAGISSMRLLHQVLTPSAMRELRWAFVQMETERSYDD